MRFITDENAGRIAALYGLSPAEMGVTVADATDVWRYIRTNEWASDRDLREWAAARGWEVDRLNRALQLLRDTQRIFAFDDSTVYPRTPPPAPAPAVVSTTPAAGEEVATNATELRAVFSRDMDPETLNLSTVRLAGPSGPIGGYTVSYDNAARAAVVTLTNPLEPGTEYTVKIDGVRASDGVALGQPFTWVFRTAAAGRVRSSRRKTAEGDESGG